MKIIKRTKKMLNRPVVLTIGNFDGLHLGHRQIIGRVIKAAGSSGASSLAVTFWPHPRRVLGAGRKESYLNTLAEKIFLFENTGLDYVWVLPFSRKMAGWSPEHFFSYLKKYLNIKKVLVGFNFALGAGKSGRLAHLRKIGRQMGFTVTGVAPVKFRSRVISSSLVRALINAGEVDRAFYKLGGGYPVFGRVVRGRGIGRTLGFPTANLAIPADKLLPPAGVYLAQVRLGRKLRPALVNVADKTRPDIHEFEVFILNYSGTLYGKLLPVFLTHKMRSEKKFKNRSLLQCQIARDVEQAIKIGTDTFRDTGFPTN